MAAHDEQVEARVAALSRKGWVPTDPDVPGTSTADTPAAGISASDDPTARATAAGEALRDRALDVALSSYVAAHGHPLDHATGTAPPPGRRWLPSRRAVLVVAGVLLLLTAAVVGRALLVVPSTVVTGGPVDPTGSAGDPAGTVGPGSADQAGEDGPESAPEAGEGAVGADAAPGVVVHVVGAVVEPGLVELAPDARVADALEAAGGPAPEADLTAVNLARTVVDGEQIHVPVPGEAPRAGADPAPAPGRGSGGASSVDLNHADALALEALPGVGPVLAERIVTWREEHGPFRSVDELTEVSGIGPAVLEKLRDHVRVG